VLIECFQAKEPVVSEKETPQSPQEDPQPAEVAAPALTPSLPTEKSHPKVEAQPPRPITPVPEAQEAEKVDTLSEGQLHTLFTGAPRFAVTHERGRPTATASHAWHEQSSTKPTSDSKRIDQPAFAAATLHKQQTSTAQTSSSEQKSYQRYDVDIVEVPSMHAAQGVEPGTIGFNHFLELPKSDGLLTGLEESQSSNGSQEARKLKEHMQSSPERIGVRAVDMSLVYDRLIELQDLCEAFHDSPGPMTILNHQSSGDLYANLFSKFLTPPGHDGNDDDPTGLRIQISTLARILELKGVWYDFSLVEWRIRLGQILWSDPEPVIDHEHHPLWTERELLLLQITLACELLLRLDAIAYTDADDAEGKVRVTEEEASNFLGSKARKLGWDLVLARRFMENILVVKSSDHVQDLRESQDSKSRSFLAMLGVSATTAEVPEAPRPDIVLLPQHQARQLSGLIKFASTIRWPSTEALIQELSRSLWGRDATQQPEQLPSPDSMFIDAITPASISVYGTPLHTPRSVDHMRDGYFERAAKPVLSRDNSQSLRIPLSPTLSPVANRPGASSASVGGWLSRSYLTGLILPGEAISHFLISTLLENDKAAIALLGDSANLYGGFTYAGRTWWSKNSIVGRVFACIDGAAECLGWISFPNPPEGLHDRWHSIHSEQLPLNDRLHDAAQSVAIHQDSAIVPYDNIETIKSEDLVLPRDPEKPTPSLTFGHWELTELNPDLIDHDVLSGPPAEDDIHVPSVTFRAADDERTCTLTLGFDVQFITSWPCKPPAATPAPSLPHILKRSLTGTISRSSSKHSTARLSRRNSHGYEPLLSHPPDSADIAPKPMCTVEDESDSDVTITKRPMGVHPLHISYSYKIVPVADVLDPDFQPPFDMHAHVLTRSNTPTGSAVLPPANVVSDKMAVLVLDARASTDMQLLARAWCAEKGYHAIIGRVGWTCLACCIREARGLGVNVVIRV